MQLAMFRGQEPAGALLEVRYRRPHGTVKRLGFYDARQVDRISAEITRVAAFADVRVGAAPRSREDGTANGIVRVWCLWVDLDDAEAIERLRTFSPRPSIVVRSGSDDCAHAYWPLRTALSPAHAQRANRRLALALGGDMAATDPPRILRPAGSLNHKHAPPRPVLCTRLELDVFDALQVVGELPDSDHYTRRARPRSEPVTGDPGRAIGGLARVVRDAPEGTRNHMLFWAAARVAEHVDAAEIDEAKALEEIRVAALAAGLPEHEVAATIRSGLAQRPCARAAA